MVVDDDLETADFISRGLKYEGYTVDVALDGFDAIRTAEVRALDLVLLDVMMPVLDGLQVATRLRQTRDVSILMISAKSSTADRIAGLDSGADDYLVKPFAFEELLARVRALLRRREFDANEVLKVGDLHLNTSTRELKCGDRHFWLSARESQLLELLMRNRGHIVSREHILGYVWGPHFDGGTNVMEVYVSYLRSKLERAQLPKLIRTVRGLGYTIDA